MKDGPKTRETMPKDFYARLVTAEKIIDLTLRTTLPGLSDDYKFVTSVMDTVDGEKTGFAIVNTNEAPAVSYTHLTLPTIYSV